MLVYTHCQGMILNTWTPRGLCWFGGHWVLVAVCPMPGETGLGTNNNVVFPSCSGTMIAMPPLNTVCHIGASPWVPSGRPIRTKPGNLFKVRRIPKSTCRPLCTCIGFALHMVCIGIMRCVGLGVTQEVLEHIFSKSLGKGLTKSYPED